MFDNKYADIYIYFLIGFLKQRQKGKKVEQNVKHWRMEVKFPKLNNGPKLSAMDGF